MVKKNHIENIFTITPEMKKTKSIVPFGEDGLPLDKQTIIESIKKHCEINASHTWYGHSHNKPPETSKVVFLCEVNLSDRNKSPCPCCLHNRTPHFKKGIAVGYPDEQAIRIIGKNCFKTLYPDLYNEAIKDFDKRNEEQYEQDVIVNNLPFLLDRINKLKNAYKVAVAVEAAHSSFHSRTKHCRICIPDEVIKDGQLIIAYMPVSSEKQKKKNFLKEKPITETHGRLVGYEILNLEITKHSIKLGEHIKKLEAIEKSGDKNRIEDLSIEKKSGIAKIVKTAVKYYNEIIKILDNLRSFFDKANIDKITSYGRSANNNIPFELTFHGNSILMNKNNVDYRVPLVDDLRIYLPEIELMAQYAQAA
jgi:hypothetical protein